MHRIAFFCAGLTALSIHSPGFSQTTVWDGLARTQFDSDDLTLRIPCVLLQDGSGASLPGFAPAYALNLLFDGSDPENPRFRLVDPIQAFDPVPASCLDELEVDGNLATYRTSSAEVDADAAVFADRFYTLELRADLSAGGAVDFSVIEAESRLYQRPNYFGEVGFANVGPPPFIRELTYGDAFFDALVNTLEASLFVSEPARIRSSCFFDDPNGLLEIIPGEGSGPTYRLRDAVSAADNGKVFNVDCTVTNLDLNRVEFSLTLFNLVIAL